MDLDVYNRSFGEFVELSDEEADNKLRRLRQQCIRDFIEQLNRRQKEWDLTYRDLLTKSREDDHKLQAASNSFTKAASPVSNVLGEISPTGNSQKTISSAIPIPTITAPPVEVEQKVAPTTECPPIKPQSPQAQQPELNPIPKIDTINKEQDDFDDPRFSNIISIREYIRIQSILNQSRSIFDEFNTNPTLKQYKNVLNLFVRTQINSISNSDTNHLNMKTKLLTNLFSGQRVSFQDRLIDANQHPQAQLFSMDLAAQTFVTVGTRLVNSVPAIAKSMATVINGIASNNLPVFRELVIGHLQERCPFLIPMYPKLEKSSNQGDCEVRYKIACGYSLDIKSQTLESEEKYLARMRSMVLIYACILIQGHMNQTWTWLASFLSLRPQPVLTATVLQAFLQESSKRLSSTYGHQYDKLLTFIRNDYLGMIEEATSKTTDRQSFIKLKNLLSDNSNLVATPSIQSIFGRIR